MYELADKGIRYLNKQYVTMFRRLNSVLKADELNIMAAVNQLFADIDPMVKDVLLRIARGTYKEIRGDHEDVIDMMFVLSLMEDYDPITRYVYTGEMDRKRSRLIEALIATRSPEEVETAMKIWARQTTQACIEITDRAALKAYKDMGVKRVIWETEEDTRVCEVCEDRQGKVYRIDKVPTKPHYRCRCWLRPFVEGGAIWPL